jgi:hypothetical protein
MGGDSKVSRVNDDRRGREPARQPRSPVESRIDSSLVDRGGVGKPLSRRARQTRRSVEAYLAAGVLPRYMERLREIDSSIAQERRRIERSYRSLARTWSHEPEHFARRWRARAEAWPLDHINELIREHNEWYPIEAALPLDPRTRDYVSIRGRSYRRDELGPEWVIDQFPPDAREAAASAAQAATTQ